jgi:hypothetical protein
MWSFVQYELNDLIGLLAVGIIIEGINIGNNAINGPHIKIINNPGINGHKLPKLMGLAKNGKILQQGQFLLLVLDRTEYHIGELSILMWVYLWKIFM